MSMLLLKDPKKMASIILERRGKRGPMPTTPDGATKDNAPQNAEAADAILNSIKVSDSGSFTSGLRSFVQSILDESTHEGGNGDS